MDFGNLLILILAAFKKVFHNCTGVFSGKSAEINRCFKGTVLNIESRPVDATVLVFGSLAPTLHPGSCLRDPIQGLRT
jgi:hypothetical protein